MNTNSAKSIVRISKTLTSKDKLRVAEDLLDSLVTTNRQSTPKRLMAVAMVGKMLREVSEEMLEGFPISKGLWGSLSDEQIAYRDSFFTTQWATETWSSTPIHQYPISFISWEMSEGQVEALAYIYIHHDPKGVGARIAVSSYSTHDERLPRIDLVVSTSEGRSGSKNTLTMKKNTPDSKEPRLILSKRKLELEIVGNRNSTTKISRTAGNFRITTPPSSKLSRPRWVLREKELEEIVEEGRRLREDLENVARMLSAPILYELLLSVVA